MAAIGKIRKQSGLLIALIGVAMLLFLLSDLFSNGTSFFTQEDQNVGTIAGQEISLQEYEIRVQEVIDQQYGVEGANEEARRNVRERVWQEMIRERILNRQLDQLGLDVSQDELMDQLKNIQPNSVLYQYFTDPQTGQIIEQFKDPQTGGLSSARVIQAVQNILNSENSKDWIPIERAIEQDVIMNKYMSLLTKGMVANSVEAAQIGKEQNTAVSFDFVVKEFSTVPNDQAKPTDEDLKAYYDEHRSEERFKQEDETRALRMALFPLQPTPEDVEELRLELKDLFEPFAADSNDTAFVSENADSRSQMLIRYQTAEDLNSEIADTVINAKIGTVFGPYSDGARMMISKLTSLEMEPDSVRARHILVNIQNGDTNAINVAKVKLDSLKTVAQKNDNFAALAEEFSEDFGSASKGGDLDWFTRGRMVAPFEKACFAGEVGDMVIVESQFGVHLINITDQTSPKPKYLMATVDRLIVPSEETSDAVYSKASRYALEYNTASDMVDIPEEEVMLEDHDMVPLTEEVIGQVRDAREIVKWAFEAEVGEVSSPFETEQYFVVAGLKGSSEEGIMSFEQAKGLIVGEVMNEKKAEIVLSELGSFGSLEEAGTSIGSEIRSANDINFSQGALPGGLGREPKVVGVAFGLSEGATSSPVIGNRGVYVLRLNSKNAGGEVDLATIKRSESSNLETRVNQRVLDALQATMGVSDKRAKYY